MCTRGRRGRSLRLLRSKNNKSVSAVRTIVKMRGETKNVLMLEQMYEMHSIQGTAGDETSVPALLPRLSLDSPEEAPVLVRFSHPSEVCEFSSSRKDEEKESAGASVIIWCFLT